MDTAVTVMELEARSYEVDVALEIKPVTYMNWIQEIAWVAAADQGCSVEWFVSNNLIPIFGASHFEKIQPIRYTDRIVARTWFMQMEGSFAERHFELRRVSDGELVLFGRVEAILLDYRTRKPTDWGEIRQRFRPDGKSVYENHQKPPMTPVADDISFQAKFPVQVAEIDMARHVNNGFYLRWITDALYNYLHPRLGKAADATSIKSLTMRYGSPISYGQQAAISGKLVGLGDGFSRWNFELGVEGSKRPATAELSVRWSPEWTAQLIGEGAAADRTGQGKP